MVGDALEDVAQGTPPGRAVELCAADTGVDALATIFDPSA
jgi:hypothetical protein